MSEEAAANSLASTALGTDLSPIAKLALAISFAIMLTGGVMIAAGAMTGSSAPATDPATSSAANETPSSPNAGVLPGGAVSGFAAGGSTSEPTPGEPSTDEPSEEPTAVMNADPSAMEAWGPTLFRLGFSFFVGFAIAYAGRTFLRISLIGLGIMLFGLFGLQYLGFIDVRWDRFSDLYDQSGPWLKTQTESFTRFIQGQVPSAASLTAGLAFGFRAGK